MASNTEDCTQVAILGYLYQWTAAMSGTVSNNNQAARTQGICPSGWAIPTKLDITSVSNSFWPTGDSMGLSIFTGSTTGWNPGYAGRRDHFGEFIEHNTNMYMWSSYLNILSYYEYFSIGYPNKSLRHYDTGAKTFSARCLKN